LFVPPPRSLSQILTKT
jgi:uncharacterized surface protein with fasciclin (FAS1) repeats